MFGFNDIDAPTLVVWLAAIGAFASIIAVGLPFLNRDSRGSRMKVVTARRSELGRRQAQENAPKAKVSLRDSVKASRTELMKTILGKLNLSNLLTSENLKEQLAQAGFRQQSAAVGFVFSRVVGAIAGVCLALFLVSIWKSFPYPFMVKVLMVGGGGLIGFFLPKILVSNMAQKRQTEMTAAFPDAMDLMVICVEAGLSIENTFDRLTDEIAESSPVLAEEIGLASAELAYLSERRQAYENFAMRTGLPAAKSLSTTLMQSESYGTPVAVALKVLANEKRDERMSTAEKKAAALPAQLTVPMIVFFLPVLFLVVIGPAVIQIINL
jgi:tight adherence protein C